MGRLFKAVKRFHKLGAIFLLMVFVGSLFPPIIFMAGFMGCNHLFEAFGVCLACIRNCSLMMKLVLFLLPLGVWKGQGK